MPDGRGGRGVPSILTFRRGSKPRRGFSGDPWELSEKRGRAEKFPAGGRFLCHESRVLLLRACQITTAALTLVARPVMAAAEPLLDLHQPLAEAWQATGLEVRNSDAVFAWVFRHLPPEVMVYPTENYFYWRLTVAGREIRGNLRPASGLREQGLVSFAYAEWLEFPDETLEATRLSIARRLGAADGVTVSCPDGFTCDISCEGKTVRFRLHQLPQLPPLPGVLGTDERFVSRTWDESGLPFLLCYHATEKCFFWVLNEAPPVAETFTVLASGIELGRRTGFVFWTDPRHAGRKILTAVRAASVARNDYCDGPFDQLADNYAAQVPLRACIEEAFPALKGGIDLYGYYTSGPDQGDRVALTSYLAYRTPGQALEFTQKAAAAPVPVAAIAAGGKHR